MFVSNYRIFDRYGMGVVSLAILADETKSWRPADRLGWKIDLVKLLYQRSYER